MHANLSSDVCVLHESTPEKWRVSLLLSSVNLQWEIWLLVVFTFAAFAVRIGSMAGVHIAISTHVVFSQQPPSAPWLDKSDLFIFHSLHLLTNLKYAMQSECSPVECWLRQRRHLGPFLSLSAHYLAFRCFSRAFFVHAAHINDI